MASQRMCKTVDCVALAGAVLIAAVGLTVLLAVLWVMLEAPSAQGAELSATVLTDGRQVDGRIGWTDGAVEAGPVFSWNEDSPEHLWGVGVYGLLDVTPDANFPVRNLFPGVGEWLNLPESIPATVRIGGQVGVGNIEGSPEAEGGPVAEIAIGPLVVSFEYMIREANGSGLPVDSEGIVLFGVKPIRFGKP